MLFNVYVSVDMFRVCRPGIGKFDDPVDRFLVCGKVIGLFFGTL